MFLSSLFSSCSTEFLFYYTWSREQTPKQSRAVSRLPAYPREGPNILSTLGTGGGGSPVSGAIKAVFSA